MKLRSRLLPLVAAGALVAAACADDEALTGDPDEGVAEVDEDVDAEEEPDDDLLEDETTEDEEAAGEAEDEAAAGQPADAPSGVTTTGIEVADSDLGAHIVTAEGMTTYGAIDQLDAEIVCVGDCAQVWQPVLVDGEPEVADEVDAEVTTVEREDGGVQIVVEGSPLHTFVVDTEAGAVGGQGSADRWFVVGATGELVDAPDPDDVEDLDEEDGEDA